MIDFQSLEDHPRLRNEPSRPLPPGVYVGERELRLDPAMTCPRCRCLLRPGDGRETEHGLEIICTNGHLLTSWE